MKFLKYILLFINFSIFSQVNFIDDNSDKSEAQKEDKYIPSIKDYKFFKLEESSVTIDTTLSIKKEYKFNYLRQDNFNYIQFHNQGQTLNTLSYDFDNYTSFSEFGASAKHFNYISSKDIDYYNVATPFTELMYKTGFTQGQVLDGLFSVNLNPQLNFSIGYKGLRSLGKYQHSLSSSGNFRFSSNYNSKSSKYKLLTHYAQQFILNQENDGLDDTQVESFVSGDTDFIDRSVFTPNYENAENTLKGRRAFLHHEYQFFNKDSTTLSVVNEASYEHKFYTFVQSDSVDTSHGEAYTTSINDSVNNKLYNSVCIYIISMNNKETKESSPKVFQLSMDSD